MAAADLAAFLLRALDYLALAVALGVPVFAVRIWSPALAARARNGSGAATDRSADAATAARRRLRRITFAAIVTGALAALGLVVLDVDVPSDGARVALVLRAAAFAVLGLALWRALDGAGTARPSGGSPDRNGPWAALALVAGVALVILPGVSGHAGADAIGWLLLPLDAIHVTAMALWIGGLAALLLASAATRAALAPAHRVRLLAAVLLAFSPLALGCVAALVVTGVIQGFVQIGTLRELVDTGYGRDLLAKALLLAGAVGLAAWSRERGVDALRAAAAARSAAPAAERVVRRALVAEFALLVVVLGVASALVVTTPP